jgi:hypothetical protein
MKKLFFLFFVCLLCGCASHRHDTFCLPDYHQSLYNYRKESTNENAQKHIEVLEKIIQHANESGIKVPPGVYLEKGYFYQIIGNEKQAEADYQEEMTLFPESKTFINKTILSKK